MNRTVIIKPEDTYFANRGSSKGNQRKWHVGNDWYKADYLGYESLAEFIVSAALAKSNAQQYVKYQICIVEENKRQYISCASVDFLHENEELISWEHLYRNINGVSLTRDMMRYESTADRITFVVNQISNITGLKQVGQYLTAILELDAIFLNEDRHLNNLAVIYDYKGKKYQMAPFFDQGAALLSDMKEDYPLQMKESEWYSTVKAKPFSVDFDEQMDEAESLFGNSLKINMNIQNILQELEYASAFYGTDIVRRVENILRHQWEKYSYMLGTKKHCTQEVVMTQYD